MFKTVKNTIGRIALLVSLLFLQEKLSGQCFANAGPDRAGCSTEPPFPLGGSQTAYGGVPPYKYSWSTDWYFPASALLDDTTKANPIVKAGFTASMVIFQLTVVDSVGNVCHDEVIVKGSQYVYLMENKVKYLKNPGDSVSLYQSIGGGIAPFKYRWSPGHSLNDSTLKNPYASPDTTTMYELIVEDSVGCLGSDEFLVIVFPLSNRKVEAGTLKVYPNPAQTSVEFSLDMADTYTLTLFDTRGQLVYTTVVNNSSIKLDTYTYKKGVYFYQIRGQGQSSNHSGKIIFE